MDIYLLGSSINNKGKEFTGICKNIYRLTGLAI